MDNFLIKIISTEMISIITERNERMQLLQQLFQGETNRNSIKDYRENTIISANINFNPFIIQSFKIIHNFTNFPLNFDQRDTNQKKSNKISKSSPFAGNRIHFTEQNDSSTCWNLHNGPYYITFHKRNGFNFPPCAPWKQFSNGEPAQLRSHFRQNRIGREWNLSIQWFECSIPNEEVLRAVLFSLLKFGFE